MDHGWCVVGYRWRGVGIGGRLNDGVYSGRLFDRDFFLRLDFDNGQAQREGQARTIYRMGEAVGCDIDGSADWFRVRREDAAFGHHAHGFLSGAMASVAFHTTTTGGE